MDNIPAIVFATGLSTDIGGITLRDIAALRILNKDYKSSFSFFEVDYVQRTFAKTDPKFKFSPETLLGSYIHIPELQCTLANMRKVCVRKRGYKYAHLLEQRFVRPQYPLDPKMIKATCEIFFNMLSYIAEDMGDAQQPFTKTDLYRRCNLWYLDFLYLCADDGVRIHYFDKYILKTPVFQKVFILLHDLHIDALEYYKFFNAWYIKDIERLDTCIDTYPWIHRGSGDTNKISIYLSILIYLADIETETEIKARLIYVTFAFLVDMFSKEVNDLTKNEKFCSTITIKCLEIQESSMHLLADTPFKQKLSSVIQSLLECLSVR
jgi:hypothetical protein